MLPSTYRNLFYALPSTVGDKGHKEEEAKRKKEAEEVKAKIKALGAPLLAPSVMSTLRNTYKNMTKEHIRKQQVRPLERERAFQGTKRRAPASALYPPHMTTVHMIGNLPPTPPPFSTRVRFRYPLTLL